MSFGFSLGDFLTTIELANKIRKEFVDAPSQFRDISNEVKSLSNVLRDIDDFLPERELTSQQQAEFHDIAEGCRNVLKTLKDSLEKYQELDCSPRSFDRKARRVWKRLRWEPEDIKELRSRIIANITLLNAFQGRLASQISLATKDGVDRLHERQDDHERRTILDWLTPTDYGTQQSDFIGRRQEGTGQWLLDSDEFQRWSNERKQTLFCPGIPGAGKTMITSIVIEHLRTKFRDDPGIGIAYVYCNFRRQQEQKPADLLASLLKQLIQRRPSVPESIIALYKRHSDERTRPSIEEISKAMHSIVADYSNVFIIIDALDECQTSDGGRRKLLSQIFNLQAETGASFFSTSRFIPEIRKEFEGSISIEIRASDDDVQRYLDNHMSQLPSYVSRSNDLQEEIKTKIIKAVDGMFLLAQLHLDSLMGKRSPKAIRIALRNLQKESKALNNDNIKALDRAYEQAMKRIEGQVADSYILATQVLSWITCTKRPLTTLELRHALGVEVGELALDEDNLPEIENTVSVCAGLVAVDEESDIIRLVHYTTQEYFERTWIYWFPDVQRHIAMTCVAYLSFDAFETGFCPTDKEFEARLQLNPLYDYAAKNWGHHARAASTEAEQLILDLLESESKVSACSQALIASKRYLWEPGYSQRVQRQMTGVHIAARFGLREVMIPLLGKGHDSNVKDTYGQTPLSWAAREGYGAVIKLLLEKDGVDPDSKDIDYGRTLLAWAAANGHKAVVELLLAKDGVDPDSKDKDGQTPLSWAGENGHEAVVELLLAKDGVDPDSMDKDGQTPLWWAAANGHEAVVRILLATDGVDPNFKDNDGRTPLSWAATGGHKAVVDLLLAKDVNPGSKDEGGRTPLSWAAENGHETVVKLLLAKDVNPDSKDEDDRTPLSWAAENGHETVVKLLLATDGMDPNFKDNDSQTPLSWAAWNGHDAVVTLLLANDGVDPDSKDNDGQTPLSLAARNGYSAVAKLLLSRDSVDPDSKNNYGWTPLWWAVKNGHKAVMELLLTNSGVNPDSKDNHNRTPLSLAAGDGYEAAVRLLLGIDGLHPNFKDKDGRTPLSWAAENGHKAVVELLFANDGVNPDVKDIRGQTPLWWATKNGHVGVVELLLEKDGVDPSSMDIKCGRTPLWWAAGSGNVAIAKLLLANNDVDPDFKDKDNRTPFSRAAQNGHEAVVELLAANCKVDIDFKNTDYGLTPLSWAAARGHEAVVKLLLAKEGVDPNSKDTKGRTPLWWAAVNGHEAVVMLLLVKDGVDPNSKDKNGRTPLFGAAAIGNDAVVKLLLAKDGVDPNSKNKYRRTPLSLAARLGHEEVVKLLLAKDGIDPNSKDYIGQTPLLWAARKGHESVVKLLLMENGVEPDCKDDNCRTPLSWAAEKGHEAVVKLLLTAKADIETEDYDGRTPLIWAAKSGCDKTVKLLLENNADVNAGDKCGSSAVQLAAFGVHKGIEQLLMKQGASEPEDFYGLQIIFPQDGP